MNRLAYVARMQRRFDEAVELVAQAHKLLAETDQERAFGFYVLSSVALDKRTWPQAIELSKQAFEIWESVGNWRMMGRSLLCRGVALQEAKQYPEAIKVDEQAISLFEKSQDTFLKAIAQMNLGIVYKDLDRPQQALALYIPAEKTFWPDRAGKKNLSPSGLFFCGAKSRTFIGIVLIIFAVMSSVAVKDCYFAHANPALRNPSSNISACSSR